MNAPKMIGTCGKCDGTGRIDAFSHISKGVCYWCKGVGTLEISAEQFALSEQQREIAAKNAADTERKAAWIATLDGKEPEEVLTMFRAMTWERVWSIREFVAGPDLREDRAGFRMAYWCASTVCNAWPHGKAYPVAWINDLRN